MKEQFIDYFEILQVHFLAETKVIKAAYRKLSMDAHPDSSRDATMMHQLNEAYEVLSNQEKRAVYVKKWAAQFNKHSVLGKEMWSSSMFDFSVQPLRLIINDYMFFLKSGMYAEAYDYISAYNRKRIFKKDFIKWQKLISKVHEIIEFDCTLIGAYEPTLELTPYLLKHKYLVFRVKVMEKNLLLNRVEEDYFSRIIVKEHDEWKLFLPNTNIRKTIKKYEKIVERHKKQKRLQLSNRQSAIHTYQTGLISKSSLLNNCEYEQLRYLRYKNHFSVASIVCQKSVLKDIVDYELYELIQDNVRILDSFCQLRENMILVLYPETDTLGCEKAIEQLMGVLSKAYGSEFIINSKSVSQRFDTVKELLSEVIRYEHI